MPIAETNSGMDSDLVESERPVETEGLVDFDGDNDPEEEEEEEEVEYEEVEEEVEEVEEDDEVEEEENEDANVADAHESLKIDQEMKDSKDDDESKQHAELLALPPQGSEVYIGGIPNDVSEEDLKSFCESVGEVTEVRIMKTNKDSRENKGFAFVTFRTKDLATKAIKDLNNTQFKGKKIKCSSSQPKNRLFIGNIPRSWGEQELRKVLTEVGPGVDVIELVKDPKNSSQNRGFAFIEYYNHACAGYSREKMSKPKFKLDNNAPTVSWADPKNSDSSASSQVKVVYVKNLPKNTTQSQLKELFEKHGDITKIVLPPAKSGQEKSRYGFIHFAERSSAMKALENENKYEIDGQAIEYSLAKPQVEAKGASGANLHSSNLLPTYPPRVGYGMIGGAYGGGYGAPVVPQQPLIYGRGPTPAGMAMMPMLLPNGQIGYVLQQPGVHPFTPPPQQRDDRSSRGSGSGGGSSRGGGGSTRSGGGSGGGSHGRRHDSGDNSRGGRYRPY